MKNKLIKIIGIAVVVFVIVFAATFVFLLLQGKEIITKQLENALHRKVSIAYVGLTLPFNLEMRNVDIPGLVKLDYTSVSPSIPGLLGGNIVLNDLHLRNPQFILERTKGNAEMPVAPVDVNMQPAVSNQQVTPGIESKTNSAKDKYLRLVIKNLDIRNGRIDFTDHALSGEGIKITLKDINLHLTNLYVYPRSEVANFELSAAIPWSEGQKEGSIEAKGWVNLFKKDMHATVNIADIDGVYLYPYYATWVNLEKNHVQSAKLNLNSNVTSTDNKLSAECHLELTDIVFKQKSEEEMSKNEKIASMVMGIFKALNKGKVVVNFTIKTRMTSPEFNFGYIKAAFDDQLKAGIEYARANNMIIDVPTIIAGRTKRTAIDLSKALYNGTFGLARVFKDTIELAFKEKEED
jgi:uncharacterized protein involved in outer membrane biogenesis